MIKLDIRSVRYDRTSNGIVFDTNPRNNRNQGVIVEISRDALEEYCRRTLEPENAVIKAVELKTFIQQAANRIPVDDGKIRLTKATLNGREWE